MKHKRYLLLLVGLVLILATSIVACNQPAPTATTQPTPRTITQTYVAKGNSSEMLTIPLKAGERVEVEVNPSVTHNSLLLSTLLDPFGNIIAESASRIVTPYEPHGQSVKDGQVLSTQKYPWRFAFIAATDGDYILEVTIGQYWPAGTIIPSSTTGSYTLKAVIYP